jgi:hypothetical protein
MNRVVGMPVFVAMVTAAVGSWAQSPMTPSRLNSPAPGSASWVEPPPSSKPALSGSAAATVPAAAPDRPAMPQAEEKSDRRPAHARRASSDSMAARLNRQELGRHPLRRRLQPRLSVLVRATETPPHASFRGAKPGLVLLG